MEEFEKKQTLETFLEHHRISIPANARLAHIGRRFSRFFPELTDPIKARDQPWTVDRINMLVSVVASSDPSKFTKRDERDFFIPAKRKKIGRVAQFMNSPEWRRLRYSILQSRGRKCECCGSEPRGTKVHVDHIKPISRNWHLRSDPANLQVLCEECNKGKGAWDETDWRAK